MPDGYSPSIRGKKSDSGFFGRIQLNQIWSLGMLLLLTLFVSVLRNCGFNRSFLFVVDFKTNNKGVISIFEA